MKTLFANLLRRHLPYQFKQTVKQMLGLPLTTLHADWSMLEPVGRADQPHTVFDLGARNGWFFSCWKDFCPNAVVHAFEPDQAAYKRLVERYKDDNAVILIDKGVGSSESVETFYHLAGSEVSSSFLQHDQAVWDEIKYQTGAVQERQLDVITLDQYCSANNVDSIYLLKIDIQGYELHALKGASQTLTTTDYVFVESAIKPLYKEASSFTSVHDYLVEQGFHLMNFRAWHRGNDVLMETDMLFRRNALAPEVDGDREKDRDYI